MPDIVLSAVYPYRGEANRLRWSHRELLTFTTASVTTMSIVRMALAIKEKVRGNIPHRMDVMFILRDGEEHEAPASPDPRFEVRSKRVGSEAHYALPYRNRTTHATFPVAGVTISFEPNGDVLRHRVDE